MAKQLPESLLGAINRNLDGIATHEDKEQVNEWYHSFNDTDVEIPNSFDSKDQIDNRLRTRLKQLMGDSDSQEIFIHTHRKILLFKVAAAAIIIFVLSTGTYFFLNRTSIQLVRRDEFFKNDVVQGGNKTILTLKDGSKISLTDAVNGEIIKQDGISIIKAADGHLIYNVKNSSARANKDLAFNTIETPRGGQYQINLPDGSKVWINAESSLRFPTYFSGSEFNVELIGEAYFEVAPNKLRKFRVKSGKQIVQVFGTHFNVNAYNNELSINTTLLEGSVLISDLTSHESKLLRPGQQARVNKTMKILNVDTQEAIAWKEGYFLFKQADIKTVMRQLERWYNISVRYEDTVSQKRFAGAIPKDLTFLQVMEILKESQLNFRMEGKEVVIIK